MSNVPDVENIILDTERVMEDDAESIITNERYIYIASVIKKCYVKKNREKLTMSDKIDRIVTNRFLAIPIFAGGHVSRLLCVCYDGWNLGD